MPPSQRQPGRGAGHARVQPGGQIASQDSGWSHAASVGIDGSYMQPGGGGGHVLRQPLQS